MKKISKAELSKMEASGARVKVKRPAKKAPPEPPAPQPAQDNEVAEAVAKQAAATSQLAHTLGQGQQQLVEELTTVLRRNQEGNDNLKPMPYRFTIQRNRRGLIESIDAYPIMED